MGSARFSTTSDFARHHADVVITCGGCQRKRTVKGKEVAMAFGAVLRIPDAEKRLVCVVCGEKKARMTPIPGERR